MKVTIKLLAVVAMLAGASAAEANESPETRADALIAELASTRGVEFVAARDRIAGLGRDEVAALTAKLQHATFSRATWKRDVALAIAHAWATSPTEARRFYTLEGLKPERYLARRRPEPEVSRELKRLRVAVPVLFELAMKTEDVYPFAARSAYPSVMSDATVNDLRAKERVALRIGVVTAIAASRHPAAGYLLEEIVRDQGAPVAVKRAAAVGLGASQAPAALTVLLPLAQDTSGEETVRLGAIAGLGQVRKVASLEALISIAKRSISNDVRRAAIAAMGSVASSWVLRQSGVDAGLELKRRAGAALVELIATANGAPDEEPLIEALVMVSDAGSRSRLAELAGDAASPEEVRARAHRALERLDRTLARES